MQCKKCGELQNDEYKFCKKCGAPLHAEELKCAHCGKEIEPDSTFCPFCGSAVAAGSRSSEAQERESVGSQRERFATNEGGGSFYDGVAAVRVKERKPLVVGQKGQYIGAMAKAWVLAALFLLMFGLSFLSFMKVDTSEYTGVDEPIKVSAVDVLEVAFSKKQSMEEVLRRLNTKISNVKDEAAAIRVLNNFNVLKLVYCKDLMEAAPFTLNVNLILQTVLVLALMLGSLVFAVLFITEALMLTLKGKSALGKDIAGLSLGIMTAIALFALSMTSKAVGGGPLSAMIIGICSLVLNTVYNIVIGGKRPESAKNLVGKCISFALGITLLFTLNCNMYGAKVDVERESLSGKPYIETVTEGFSIDELIGGIDLFAAKEDSILYLKDKALADVVDSEYIAAEDVIGSVLPPSLYFYAEMSVGYNTEGLVLGILSVITFFMTGVSLAVLLALLMISLTDFKRKSAFAALLLSLIGSVGLLIVSIICTATASLIMSQLGYDEIYKIVIGAAPIVNIVLSAGMFVQHCILKDRKAKER